MKKVLTISNTCVILSIVERHKTPTEIDWLNKSFMKTTKKSIDKR